MKPWWKVIIAYPLTWLAVAVVAAALYLFVTVGQPSSLLAGVGIGVGVLALATWPLALAIGGTMNRLQFTEPVPEVDDSQVLAELAAELDGLDDPRPARQLASISEKRDGLIEVLDRRLDAGELTYGRYRAATEQVYQAALENLNEVAVAVRSVNSIDENYIADRLTQLDADGEDDATGVMERETLTDRLEIRRRQEDRVAELLAQNEAGMTAMARTASALADVPIGRTPQNVARAMEQLEELAKRTHDYAPGES